MIETLFRGAAFSREKKMNTERGSINVGESNPGTPLFSFLYSALIIGGPVVGVFGISLEWYRTSVEK